MPFVMCVQEQSEFMCMYLFSPDIHFGRFCWFASNHFEVPSTPRAPGSPTLSAGPLPSSDDASAMDSTPGKHDCVLISHSHTA